MSCIIQTPKLASLRLQYYAASATPFRATKGPASFANRLARTLPLQSPLLSLSITRSWSLLRTRQFKKTDDSLPATQFDACSFIKQTDFSNPIHVARVYLEISRHRFGVDFPNGAFWQNGNEMRECPLPIVIKPSTTAAQKAFGTPQCRGMIMLGCMFLPGITPPNSCHILLATIGQPVGTLFVTQPIRFKPLTDNEKGMINPIGRDFQTEDYVAQQYRVTRKHNYFEDYHEEEYPWTFLEYRLKEAAKRRIREIEKPGHNKTWLAKVGTTDNFDGIQMPLKYFYCKECTHRNAIEQINIPWEDLIVMYDLLVSDAHKANLDLNSCFELRRSLPARYIDMVEESCWYLGSEPEDEEDEAAKITKANKATSKTDFTKGNCLGEEPESKAGGDCVKEECAKENSVE